MNIVNTSSLAATIDAINEACFFEKPLPRSQKEKAAKWIAGRQGLPGSYRGMFAPTQRDFAEGVKVFTGESVRSRAAVGHILGEEACRALVMLDPDSDYARDAVERARNGLMEAVRQYETGESSGFYCCGICSVAFWRNLSVGGLEDSRERLKDGIGKMRMLRRPDGKWGRFPFFYSLLALSEIDIPEAREEMSFAAPECRRVLRAAKRSNRTSVRRRMVAERVLENI